MPHLYWYTRPTYGQAVCQIGAHVTVKHKSGRELEGLLTDVALTLDTTGRLDGSDTLILQDHRGVATAINLADVTELGGSRED